MSATGNEVVALSQLKEAISQSSQSGIVMAIKPLYRSDNIDNLTDISDTGIYYRVEGGTHHGTLPFGGGTVFCVLVFPLVWISGNQMMAQILIYLGGMMHIRTMESDGALSTWKQYSYTNTNK